MDELCFRRTDSRAERRRVLTEILGQVDNHDRRFVHAQSETDYRCDIIARLPLEISVHILQYLDVIFSFSLQRVCKSWTVVFRSPHYAHVMLRTQFPEESDDRREELRTDNEVLLERAQRWFAFKSGRPYKKTEITICGGIEDEIHDSAYSNGVVAYLCEFEEREFRHSLEVYMLKTGKHLSIQGENLEHLCGLKITGSFIIATYESIRGALHILDLETEETRIVQLPSVPKHYLACSGTRDILISLQDQTWLYNWDTQVTRELPPRPGVIVWATSTRVTCLQTSELESAVEVTCTTYSHEGSDQFVSSTIIDKCNDALSTNRMVPYNFNGLWTLARAFTDTKKFIDGRIGRHSEEIFLILFNTKTFTVSCQQLCDRAKAVYGRGLTEGASLSPRRDDLHSKSTGFPVFWRDYAYMAYNFNSTVAVLDLKTRTYHQSEISGVDEFFEESDCGLGQTDENPLQVRRKMPSIGSPIRRDIRGDENFIICTIRVGIETRLEVFSFHPNCSLPNESQAYANKRKILREFRETIGETPYSRCVRDFISHLSSETFGEKGYDVVNAERVEDTES